MKKSFPLINIFIFLAFQSVFSQETSFQITHGPYIQGLTQNEVTIVWTTSQNAISWVELAPNDGTDFYLKERPKFFASTDGIKNIGIVHSVTLNNLSPATKYRYRIYSQEVLKHDGAKVQYGEFAATRVFKKLPLEFETVDPTANEFSFLIVNDIHGKNDVLQTLLEKASFKKSDCIFFNGDMMNNFISEEQMFNDFMDTSILLFAQEKPVYFVRGNHETRGEFASNFSQYFFSSNGNTYYLLRRGPICFVVLDSGEDKPDSDIEYYGLSDFDEFRNQEKIWLTNAVKQKEFTDAPIKIAIVHMPPLGGWHGENEVMGKFIPILNEAGIDVMFCGHLHRYEKVDRMPGVGFPVILNSNNTVVKANGNKERLDVKVLDLKGATVDEFLVDPKK